MNPVVTAWILFAAVGAVCGILLDLTVMMIRTAINKTKPWLAALDEEGGIDYLGRAKMDKGHLVVGKDDQKRRYPVLKESRRVTNNGILYVVGRQTGANLEVPSKDDMLKSMSEGERVAFNLCDPLLLAKVFDKNQFQETVTGQNEKENVLAKAIIPLSILAGLAIVGLIILVAVVGG